MSISVSEFAMLVLLTGLLLGGLLWRYAWARRLAALAIVAYAGWVIGGDAYGVTLLIAAIGVGAIAALARGLNPTKPHQRTKPLR